jgi:hypothetical protein
MRLVGLVRPLLCGGDRESPANKRIQDFATRANLTGKEGIDKKELVLLAVGLEQQSCSFWSRSFNRSR